MMTYMLDTNICIYVMKNRPEIVRQYFSLHAHQLCISSVVMMELLYGAEKSELKEQNLLAIYDFTSHIPIIDFDTKASAHSANIKATLEKQGTPIGAYDAMIAGHARSLGLIVVTNNEREFKRVDGLRVENWAN